MPLRIPAEVTGLEQSIEQQAKRAGRNLKLNLGTSARSIEGLSQPLGRITGKADEFTKSMEAANARVLAFGASVGVLNAVTQGFKNLVTTTIQVEKQLASINTILGATSGQLNKFKDTIFEVARNTEQSFDTVANAALELSRQGLKAEQVTERLNDSLILARLSGLGASEAVAGLTAAINSFKKEGVTSAEVLNKLSAASIKAAVSERDLIEGIKRSGSVATQAGVSLDELVGVISAVQERTARGGAVIGNSFKTIFTRIQSLDKLKTMQNLGVQIEDASGKILSGTQLIQNLGKTIETLPDAEKLAIAENLVGKFQIAPFLAILEDYNSETSKAIEITAVAQGAFNEAYERNIGLNQTLSAAINEATINLQQLAEQIGKIGISDSLKGVLDFVNNLATDIRGILDGDGIGSQFAKGFIKAVGGVLSGPGLAIFIGIIGKLTIDLARFGVGSLKTFFGLNRAAKEQATLQGQIASSLLSNKGIQDAILKIERSQVSAEEKKAQQTKFFTTALREQLAVMQTMQGIAAKVAPGVMAGTRGAGRGRGAFGRGAGGFIPNYNAIIGYGSEQADINRGVGGAPSSAKPVAIPNFNFGGGQKGTMIANTSEFMVPNFAGTGGSAIFNKDMVSSMGLPAGARKITAAGGFVPNFAKPKSDMVDASPFFMLVPQMKAGPFPLGEKTIDGIKVGGGRGFGFKKGKVKTVTDKEEEQFAKRMKASIIRHTAKFTRTFKPLGRTASEAEVRQGFDQERGAKGALQAVMGSAFEVGIIKALDYKAAVREKGGDFDVRMGTNLEKIRQLFGLRAADNTGDFKISASSDNVKSFYKKVIKERAAGKMDLRSEKKGAALKLATQDVKRENPSLFTKSGQPRFADREQVNRLIQARLPAARATLSRGASGYIPNFAMSPLDDAVARERAAGLPINQIRINQDASLRNAGNPMGLAVTNTRDEPTGAIPAARGFVPNFQQIGPRMQDGSFVKNSGQVAKAQRDMLGPIFALTTGFAALQGATSGAEEGIGKMTNEAAKGAMALTSIAFAGSAIKGFANDLAGSQSAVTAGFGKVLGGITLLGAGVAAGITAFKTINKVIYEGSDASKINADNLNLLSDAAKNAARNLNNLGDLERGILEREAKLEAGTAQFTDAVIAANPRSLLRKAANPLSNAAGQIRVPDGKGGFQIGGVGARAFELKGTGVGGRFTDEELVKTIDTMFRDAALNQIPASEVRELLRQAAVGGETKEVRTGVGKDDVIQREILEPRELDKALKEFLKLLRSSNDDFEKEQKAFRDALRKSAGGGAEGVGNLKDLEALLQDPSAQVGGAKGALFALREAAGDPTAGATLTRAEKEKIIKEEIKRIEQEINTEVDNGRRLELESQKAILQAALDKRKIELSNTKELDLQIAKAQALGNLTGKQLRALQLEKAERLESNKLIDERLGIIGKEVKAVTGVSIGEKQRDDLRDRFNKLKREELMKDEKILAILKEVISLDGKRVINSDEIAARVLETLKATEDGTKAQSNFNIELLKGKNLTQDIADNIKFTTEQLRNAASMDAFGVTQGNVRANQADRDTISRLQNQLSGADPKTAFAIRSQIRGLESGIAGRGISTAGAGALQTAKLQALAVAQKAEGIDLRTGLSKSFIQTGAVSANQDAKSILGFLKGVSKERTPEGELTAQAQLALNAIPTVQRAITTAADAMTAAGDAANQAANGLDELDKAILDSGEALRQSQVLGLGVRAAERRQQARKGAFGQNLSQQNAMLLSDMQRGAFKRFAEETQFEGLTNFDTLADTIKNAALSFKSTMSDALVDSIAKGESLGNALRSAATDFFNMMSKALMKSSIDQIIGGALGNDQSRGGGFISALFRNSGGMIRGGSGVKDDVPALLTGGEFVMRKSAVDKFGPNFMESLNSGKIPMFNRGGLFTPGSFGQGAITGSSNLLSFATQSFTGGGFDRIGGGKGLGFASLEPQSGRLTMFGRRNSPMFQREQQSKQEAFGLFARQAQLEAQLKEQRKKERKAFLGSIIGLVSSIAISEVTSGLFGSKKGKKGNIAQRISAIEESLGMSTDLGGGPVGILPFRGQANPKGNRAIGDAMLNGTFRFATGGYIAPSAGIDNVPAMLSGGEFVMNAAATQRIGRGNLAAANSGATGGDDKQAVINRLDQLIAVSSDRGETVVNITINSDGTETQGGNAEEDQQNLAKKIKDVVKQTISDEKRLGGSLRRQ